MKQKNYLGFIALFSLGLLLGFDTFFAVDQREKALVLQFGELVNVHGKPGLKMKLPFIQDVIRYDARLLNFNLPIMKVTAGDQKRMMIDMYIRYSIEDVLLFYKKVRNEVGAQKRLETIADSSLRRVIGRIPLSQMLSENRSKIMGEIQEDVRTSAKVFGIKLEDVRIIAADLPTQNREAIFQRMESERTQEAKQFRAEGEEVARGIRAEADREKQVILAEAKRKADILKGETDAKVIKIYAEVYGQDKEFYALYRSLEAYQNVLKPENTTIMLSLTNPFLKYFGLSKNIK